MAIDADNIPLNFSGLVQLVSILKSPNGCPWDAKQSPVTLSSYILEESHELINAILNEGEEEVIAETGDLLFLLVFLTHLYHEKGGHTIEDVIKNSIRKMVKRHPHVFSFDEELSADEVIKRWHNIKQKENKNRKSHLDGIPDSLPSLAKAHRFSERASKIGFDWPDTGQIFDKISEELSELKMTIEKDDHNSIEAELGDVLFTVVNLGMALKLNAERALSLSNIKFKKRFMILEKLVRDDRGAMENVPMEELEKAWLKAKLEVP